MYKYDESIPTKCLWSQTIFIKPDYEGANESYSWEWEFRLGFSFLFFLAGFILTTVSLGLLFTYVFMDKRTGPRLSVLSNTSAILK